MKHTTGPRRGRSRGNGKRFSTGGGGGGKNQTFESSGPEVKIRGSAQQVYEKYLSLARDAVSAGDRIAAEGFFQFADHYYRLVNAANGNGQSRGDQNNRIPPPAESAAGSFDGEDEMSEQSADDSEDDGMDDDDDMSSRSDDGDQRRTEQPYPSQRPADEFRPMRPAEPIHRARVAEVAEEEVPTPQVQTPVRYEDAADANGQADEASAETAEENGSRRGPRTLGLNLGGRRTLGRRSQRAAEGETPAAVAEGAGNEMPAEAPAPADVPSSESREGGFLAPKPIRRRVRRVTPKSKEPAGAA